MPKLSQASEQWYGSHFGVSHDIGTSGVSYTYKSFCDCDMIHDVYYLLKLKLGVFDYSN